MRNKLIDSELTLLKVYEKKTILPICQKQNLVSGRMIVLLKMGIAQSK